MRNVRMRMQFATVSFITICALAAHATLKKPFVEPLAMENVEALASGEYWPINYMSYDIWSLLKKYVMIEDSRQESEVRHHFESEISYSKALAIRNHFSYSNYHCAIHCTEFGKETYDVSYDEEVFYYVHWFFRKEDESGVKDSSLPIVTEEHRKLSTCSSDYSTHIYLPNS